MFDCVLNTPAIRIIGNKTKFDIQNSIWRSTKHLQVVYFHFEYYCTFANFINTKTGFSAFIKPFQSVSHVYPTTPSVMKSFLKYPTEFN